MKLPLQSVAQALSFDGRIYDADGNTLAICASKEDGERLTRIANAHNALVQAAKHTVHYLTRSDRTHLDSGNLCASADEALAMVKGD